MTIEELQALEEQADQKVSEACSALSARKAELNDVRFKICRAYEEKYREYIGKKVCVTTEQSGWGKDRPYIKEKTGYLKGVGYDTSTSVGYYLYMSKLKKDGSESMNRYIPYDSPKVKYITKIEIL